MWMFQNPSPRIWQFGYCAPLSQTLCYKHLLTESKLLHWSHKGITCTPKAYMTIPLSYSPSQGSCFWFYHKQGSYPRQTAFNSNFPQRNRALKFIPHLHENLSRSCRCVENTFLNASKTEHHNIRRLLPVLNSCNSFALPLENWSLERVKT